MATVTNKLASVPVRDVRTRFFPVMRTDADANRTWNPGYWVTVLADSMVLVGSGHGSLRDLRQARCLTRFLGNRTIILSSVLRPRQHSIGYMGDFYMEGFYRSKDPTNSIKVLKEDLQKTKQITKTTKYTYAHTIIERQKDIHKISTASP